MDRDEVKILIIIIIIIIKFTLEQARTSQKGRRFILYSSFNLGCKWGGWSTPRPGRFTPGKDPVPIV